MQKEVEARTFFAFCILHFVSLDPRPSTLDPKSPVPRRHPARTENDRLTCESFGGIEFVARGDTSLDRGGRAEIVGSIENADDASAADADGAARVANRSAGAAGEVEHGFVGSGLSLEPDGEEIYDF